MDERLDGIYETQAYVAEHGEKERHERLSRSGVYSTDRQTDRQTDKWESKI
jgi:hypothetical protein